MQRKEFAKEISGYLGSGEFERLESLEAELWKSKARFPGGDWKVDRFYEALNEMQEGASEEEWQRHIARIRKWVQVSPGSVLAKVTLADALSAFAWKARGKGFSDTVTDRGWELFSERLKKSEAVLRDAYPDRAKCLNWYTVMNAVSKGKQAPLEELDVLFREAVSLEPMYWDFYVSKAVNLLPRWYGKPGDWQAFAESVAKERGGDDGEELYTVIAWFMYRHHCCEGSFFKENKVGWDRVKKGFILMEKRYGPSYRYLNAFCLMAGNAVDRNATRILLTRIGDHWEPAFWGNKAYFESYQKWAFNK